MDEKDMTIPEQLREEKAQKMYTALCGEYLRVHGVDVIPDSSLALLTDICMAEQIKTRLLQEIEKRPIDHVRNGRQEYWKPNAAIAEVNRLSATQRRNLAELKLTPASRKGAADAPADDEFTAY